MSLLQSDCHPHEPEIPPAFDAEGRCRVCGLLVEIDRLREALEEAIAWARRPSPIPIVPFDEFLQEMGKLGCGPRASIQTVTKPADLPITGERPRDAGTSGAAT